MTDEVPRPRRMRKPAEPERLIPGLYAVGRFGDRHDLTDPEHKWLSHLADADLYAVEGYLRHALARAEQERFYREHDHQNRLSRALDLRDAETNLPQRRPTIVTTAANRPSLEILERVAEGLRAEELAADPEVKAVLDESVNEHERTRDEARMGPDLGDDPDGDIDGYDGATLPLPQEIADKIAEAKAHPERNVPFNRAEREAKRANRKAMTEPESNTAGRPAQPWDNDSDDPWEGIGGSGA